MPPVNRGIQAAVVLPYREDYSIDEAGYVAQLRFVLAHAGITGLLVNGHAGENMMTTDAEKARIVRLTRENVPAALSVTSGVLAENSLHAAAQAKALEAAGADALLVFPPFSWASGTESATIVEHHRHIHDAAAVPILVYTAPVSGSLAYADAALDGLLELPRVRGIKDGSWEIATSERLAHRVRAQRPDVMVMGSGDEHLMLNYFLGTEGSQVSLATVIPGLICELWDAAEAGDWDAARQCHSKIQPLAHLIYREAPAARAVARLKACLKILGVLENDRVRPPIPPLPPYEYERLEAALREYLGSVTSLNRI